MLKIGEIVLYSSWPERLAKFLSEIFDLEIIHLDCDRLFVGNDSLKFLIFPRSGQVLGDDLVVSFCVNSLSELEQVKQNIEFLNYRFDEKQARALSMQETDFEFYFEMLDPDFHKWRFSYRKGL